MEMKKQVMSFEEFIFEAYQTINEAETFEEAKQKLSKLLDKNGNAALGTLESLLKSNSSEVGKDGKLLQFTGEKLNRLVKLYDGENRELTGITVDISPIGKTKQDRVDVIQGNVFVGKAITGSGMAGPTVEIIDGKANIGNLLSTINSRNIYEKANSGLFQQNKKGKYKLTPVKKGERDGIFPGTGIDLQFVLTSNGASGLEFNQSRKESATDTLVSLGTNIKHNPETKETFPSYCTLVLYLVKEIIPNGGNPTSIEKVDKVVKIVTGGDENLDIDIADNGTLFEKSKSKLLDAGKSNISNAILNQFTSVSSIEVVGGASKEGNPDFNKKLCKDRAESVKAYLSEITKATVEVSSEANIQPQESTEDLSTWRKVTLKIKGTRVKQSSPKEEVSYVARSKEFKPDAAILAQVAIEFEIKTSED